jgi:hypothetical protein
LHALKTEETCDLSTHFNDGCLVSLAPSLFSRLVVQPRELVIGLKDSNQLVMNELQDGAPTRVLAI